MAQLGSYELVERIGQGGMAEVFLARRASEGVEKRLVIKRILPEFNQMPEFVQMFIREARIAATLEHPNITQVFDFGQAAGAHYLAIEYVQGTDLYHLIEAARAAGEKLPIPVALKICALTCEALSYAHALTDDAGESLGFIHRDISPDNILIGYSGAVKVSDFGIARVRTLPKVTQTGMLKGKPHYAAPEYLRGKGVDHRGDLFALGVVLFEALTSEKPFDAPNLIDVIRTVVTQPTPDPRAHRPELGEDLVAIVDRALQKDPNARYADAGELQADLEAALQNLGAVVTGRTIAELAKRLVPPRAPRPIPLEKEGSGQSPTFVSQRGLQPRTSAPEPLVHVKTDPLANAEDGTVVRQVTDAGRKPVAPARAAPEKKRAPEPPPPRKSSKWASADEGPPDTVPDEKLSGVVLAQQRAFELADAKLPDDDDPESAGKKKKKLSASLIIPLAVAGALTIFALTQFAPGGRRLVQGAQVVNTPDKKLQITANVTTADVFINDTQLIGHTPMDVENTYPFGQHVAVTIRALGYSPVQTEFVGGRGQSVVVTFAQAPEE